MLKKIAALSHRFLAILDATTLRTFAGIALTVYLLPLSPAAAGDLSGKSWDEIVTLAKEEGEVTWFNWYFQDRFREEVKAFESEYGIKVSVPDGEAAANFKKFLAEKDRPQGDIDALSITATNFSQVDAVKYLTGGLDRILPGADKLIYAVEGLETKGYGVAFWGNQTGIAYNPARIEAAKLPHSLAEFETFMAENPGEFGFNAENGGAGPSFVEGVLRATVKDVDYGSGKSSPEILAKLAPVWDWFIARENEFVITASNADSVTRLNSGEFMIVASYEDMISSLQKKGEISPDIKLYIPDFGMPSGGNLVVIPANAKHKAAALVLVHWLTSARTQTTFSEHFGAVPQNLDASSDAALVSKEERAKATNRIAKPLSDDVRAAFIDKVTLN